MNPIEGQSFPPHSSVMGLSKNTCDACLLISPEHTALSFLPSELEWNKKHFCAAELSHIILEWGTLCGLQYSLTKHPYKRPHAKWNTFDFFFF